MSQGQFPFSWVWRTALRDARGARAKAVLYAASMALGLAALIAMISFSADLRQAVSQKTQTLVGADLIVYSRQAFEGEGEALLKGFPGEQAAMMRFATMAYFVDKDEALLCRVRAIEGDFPFYGTLETEPLSAATTYKSGPNVLVDRSLMERVGAAVGDTLKLGDQSFTIAGVLLATPGEPASAPLFGPRVYMPARYVPETNLISQGSRVFYSRAFKLPTDVDADALVEANKEPLRKLRYSWDTVAKREQELGEAMAQLSHFLNLAACLALLLGGVGVASAVHYHLKQKQRQIAVMRCLGATSSHVTAVYLLQVLILASVAAVLGVALGIAIQFFFPRLLAAIFPFELEPRLQPMAIAVAVSWGLLLSLVLTLAPLLSIRRISPLASFRVHLKAGQSRAASYWAYATVLMAWWGFACWQTRSLAIGSAFLGGLGVAIGLLWGTGWLCARLARAWIGPRMPFVWRHGIASLFRPNNQTGPLTVIIGMGVFLLVLLAGARATLLDQFNGARHADRPNFIAFDIQPDQIDAVRETIDSLGMPVRQVVPIVPMRLESVNGQAIADLLGGDIPDWVLQREYRSTYRAELHDTEELVAGNWVERVAEDEALIPISIEQDIAETLQVGLGDRLVVDVMGIPLEVIIRSVRVVDWQSMQPNFYMVFPAGILEQAPHMFLLTSKTKGPMEVAELQRSLVKSFPNVACADMTQLVRTLDDIIGKAAAVVQFLAGLCLAVGLFLIMSALWNSRAQRLAEHALLRTLGAKRSQVGQVAMVEYLLLGLSASFSGTFLAVIGGWLISRFLFQVPAAPNVLAIAIPLITVPLLTLLLGFLSQGGGAKNSPLLLLREEGG